MPIDPYLARGITPLGAGLGDTVEMMNQMRNRNALTQDARMRTDAYTQDVNNRQMNAQKEQEARAKYAEMVGLSNAPPEYQAKYVDMQKAQHPEFMQTPFAQMEPTAAFKAMRDALAAQLGEKPPEPPPVQPTFVNDRSGYSYGWDPTQGVLPGSMQTPQRAPQTGPTPDMQNWGFRSRLPPDQRADWDAQHGAGSGGAYRDMTPAEVTAVGLPAGTLAQRTAAGKIDVVNKPKGADLAPKDVTTIKTKLANISTAKRQLQLVKNKFAEMKDTMATGPGSAWAMPLSEKGQQFDSAVDSMRDSITSITRVPGIGSQSDWEGRLTQAKMPSRNKYESVTAQQIQSLEDLLNGLDSGYADMLSSDGVAPAAPNPGDNVRGFIFIGGDPGDKKNWTPDRSKR